jgi:sporulation protein YlmC with PRC-barrel domain
MTKSPTATMYVLGDRGQTIDGSANDIRGRHVRDNNANSLGKVADLLVDDQDDKVRFLLVEHGGLLGFGETKTLIPVDAITKITEYDVYVDQSRERIASAPAYDPDLIDNRPYHSDVYSHYGLGPHWGDGYMYPTDLTLFPTLRPRSRR